MFDKVTSHFFSCTNTDKVYWRAGSAWIGYYIPEAEHDFAPSKAASFGGGVQQSIKGELMGN